MQTNPVKAAAAAKKKPGVQVIGTCPHPLCGKAVTEEHQFDSKLHRLDGKPLHPECFYRLPATLANRCSL